MKRIPTALLTIALAFGAHAQRIVTSLNTGWKFTTETGANETAPTDRWSNVSLPHTWNDKDAQDVVRKPGDDKSVSTYLRTCGWYQNTLQIPADWKGQKRTFVRFEAASVVATVYLNGRIIGDHKGAFTAFCMELTDDLKYGADNDLRVEVDNRWRADVPPISGGFAIFGGLYRPAQLIVTDQLCISPLAYGSSGVTIDPNNDGSVDMEYCLSYNKYSYAKMDVSVPESNARVLTYIYDADGTEVARHEEHIQHPAGDGLYHQQLTVSHPHLWQGIQDPYLYHARLELYEGDTLRDVMNQRFGFRQVAISKQSGFTLNGKPYPVYGVSRHQDLRDKGWALTYEDDLRDLQLMKEMGVTAIRMAHYPQSEQIHQLCDSMGFLVWDEVSLVNETRNNEAFCANTETFAKEMILQLYNHPSVAWWGIFNELDHPAVNHPNSLLEGLNFIFHEVGGQRLTASASNKGNRYYNSIADAPAWNNYPGWYWMLRWPYEEENKGRVGGFGEWMDYRSKEIDGRRFALSEYGAGGNPTQHLDSPLPEQLMKTMNSPYHPEEWQSYVHEEDWRTILHHNDQLWGSFVWAMFDFIVPGWSEGGLDNINTKGLVTHDRKIRKDAFYFYKANWNREPMLYIASRRFTDRNQSTTDIKVYTNCPEATLYINGKKVATKTADEIHVCRFEGIELKPGINKIKVVGKYGKNRLSDQCEWIYTSPTD